MNDDELGDRLLSLQAEPSRYTRRIERVLPQIEDALAKGVSRERVVAALREADINVTLEGFSTALYRLRKKRDAKGGAVEGPAAQAPATEDASIARVPVTEGAPSEPAAGAAKETKTRLAFDDLRDIARNRPDLAELERIGREAAKDRAAKAKAKS